MSIRHAKLTLNWKAHINKLWNVDIKLKSSCQCVMQNKLRNVDKVEKLVSMSYVKLILSWKAHFNKQCKWAELINHAKRKSFAMEKKWVFL